jgi:hypothetical protein
MTAAAVAAVQWLGGSNSSCKIKMRLQSQTHDVYRHPVLQQLPHGSAVACCSMASALQEQAHSNAHPAVDAATR